MRSHLLDLVTVDQRAGKTPSSRERVNQLIAFWSVHHKKVETVDEKSGSELALPRSSTLVEHESRFTPMHIAFPVVLERMFLNLWRQREVCILCVE